MSNARTVGRLTDDAGVTEPVTIHQTLTSPLRKFRCNRQTFTGSVEGSNDRRHLRRLGTDAHTVNAERKQVRHLRQQIVGLRGHRLDAVDRQERLRLARAQRQSVGMLQTLELTVVFVEAVVAGGEAAGRESERQLAEDEDLAWHASRALAVQAGDQLPVALEWGGSVASRRGQKWREWLRYKCSDAVRRRKAVGDDVDGAEIIDFEQGAWDVAECCLQTANGFQIVFRFD